MALLIDFLFRWLHLIFGITWIGMLYYFNFVQGGYFKSATPEALADAKKKLAPEALWWFRWGAMGTFLTGLVLLHTLARGGILNDYIVVGALLGTLMFLNVWLVIWPAQKIALGMIEGDGPANAAKALLASRTNTLFSGPMAFGMMAGPHFGGYVDARILSEGSTGVGLGLIIAVAIIALLEANALKGKLGPLTSVKGVIHCSLLLTAVLMGAVYYL